MRWYDDLYVGYNLLDKKRQVMWKIKRGKQQFNKYVITLPFNDYDVLDIYPSNVLTQKWYKDSDIVIVGIAEGREEAMDMVQLIIMDCLNSTGGCKVKDYILNLMNEERSKREEQPMVHILLLILKIIGIIVLSILGLALLILLFPIAYVGKVNGNIEEKKITGNIRAGWLFHLLHCRLWIENTEIHYNIRLLGIKIKSSETKEKKKKEKRKNQPEEQSPKNEEEKSQDELKEDSVKKTDIKQIGTSENEKEQEIQNSNVEETDVKNQNNENIKSEDSKNTTETNNRKKEKKSFITRMQISFKKLKQRIKKIVENIKDKIHNIKENAKNKKSSIDEIINQIKTVKQFITSKTTKEAYAYGKKMVLKLLKHLAPNRIKGNLYMGFEESYLTGEALGALGMIYGIFNINPKRFKVYPDFENKVFKGDIIFKGHIYLGVVIIYCLKFYFNKNIKRIIKKFI